MLHPAIASFSCAVLIFASAAPAEDWPEFRGPTGQGLSQAKNLPAEWSDTKNVAWKQAIPGKGWSSPVVVKERIYLTTAVGGGDGSGQSLRVLCLSAADGKAVWDTEVFPRPISKGHQKNSQASPTPVIEGDRLYAHFGHMGTACLDLTGKVLWRNETIKYSPVHGNGGSPVIVGDALFFSCDGAANPFLVALNKKNGEVLWRVARETASAKKFSFSTALGITVDGQKEIISPGSGAVCALDPKDGHEIWRVDYGEGYSVIPRPVFGNGLLIVPTGFDHPTVIAIRPDGHGNVTDTHVAWKITKGAPNTPSPLMVGDEVYLVSDGGIATCADAKTGAIHWQERIGGNYSASPVYADGKVYFQSEEGKGVVVAAGKEFKKLAENVLGERTLASYAVTDGSIFIRAERNLYRIGNGVAKKTASK